MTDNYDPVVIEIRKLLENFEQREPYITNTAVRIYLELGKKVAASPMYVKEIELKAKKLGYANGYAAGRRNGKSYGTGAGA